MLIIVGSMKTGPEVYCCLVILLVNVVASLQGTPRLTKTTFTLHYFCCSLAFFFLLDSVPAPMKQQKLMKLVKPVAISSRAHFL